MQTESLHLLNEINRAIIKFRGLYSHWSAEHQITYHELLVLYTVREYGFCTQKQICDCYLLPKQTMHNVISAMKKNGLLAYSEQYSSGREKALVLTKKGTDYFAPVIAALNTIEEQAVQRLGKEKLLTLIRLLMEYDQALHTAMEESR